MNPQIPDDLQSTRDLLAGSLQMHATEKAPAVPAELLDDLMRRFDAAPAAAAPVRSMSWLAIVQAFISRPAFGVTAIACLILGLAVPGLMDSSTHGKSGFRGAVSNPASSAAVRIILLKASPEILHQLEASGDFEDGAISATDQLDATLTGARIVADFESATITAITADGQVAYSAPLPENPADLSAEIATALSRL
jgi:hypothetical protein